MLSFSLSLSFICSAYHSCLMLSDRQFCFVGEREKERYVTVRGFYSHARNRNNCVLRGKDKNGKKRALKYRFPMTRQYVCATLQFPSL